MDDGAARRMTGAVEGDGSADPRTVLHVFPTFCVGGVPIRIVDVANRLGAGFRHRVVALDGRMDALARVRAGTDFQAAPAVPAAARRGNLLAIMRYLKRMPVDLLCTYNFGAMDWCLGRALSGAPAHLHFESGFGPDEAHKPLLRRNLYRAVALRGAHRLVVPSYTLQRLAARHRWAAAAKTKLVPNGVDTALFTPAERGEARRPRPGGERPVTVATVAPLRAEKRLDRLVAAVASLAAASGAQAGPSFRVVITGDGPERPALERAVSDRGLADLVALPGARDDVAAALQAADVFVMTSETEQMPNALLQAMAAGLPVAAFDAGDIKVILPPEQLPFVCGQGDELAFGVALARLIGDPALRQTLGAANRRRVEQAYGIDTMVEAYRRLYAAAIGGRA
ncbi:hypothetical protein CCR80_03835 [Rhodothalassium salexigens]|nr:hypothetical protein [Rhodothalassium salexigens]